MRGAVSSKKWQSADHSRVFPTPGHPITHSYHSYPPHDPLPHFLMDNLAKTILENFVESANEVIFMKLVRSQTDLSDEEKDSFHPEYCHQLFGESESIFGFKGLKIFIFYSSSTLQRFISMSFVEKIPLEISKGVEPDDILALIREHIPGHFTTNVDEFSEQLAAEAKFRPVGEKLNQTTLSDGRIFEVYHCDMSVPGFSEQHNRMQTWLKWFVDAASYIDTDDDRWEFYTLYEKTGEIRSNGASEANGTCSRYHFAGYCTVYKYYAYPDKMRPRISQFLILPPFQRHGLGAHLLQSVYNRYQNSADVVDIAVEDPADNFSRLRDFVDVRNSLKLMESGNNDLFKSWSPELAQLMQSKLKLNRNQARRVYEILKLRSIDRTDEAAVKAFRLEVKNRLNVSFRRLKHTESPVPDDIRLDTLSKLYDQIQEEYLETIGKLTSY